MRDFFFHTLIGQLILIVLEALAILVPLLIMVAYLTLAERKVLAAIQLRKGPNVVGPFGLFQPFADAIKMVMKETIIPMGSNRLLFLMAPMLTFSLAMIAWAVIPVNNNWAVADINVGILYLFAISSLGVYGIIIAGWASNSKYAFLGALRSDAQMVSYEVSMGFVMVSVLLCAGSLRLNDIVTAQSHIWFCIPLFPMFIVFIILILIHFLGVIFSFIILFIVLLNSTNRILLSFRINNMSKQLLIIDGNLDESARMAAGKAADKIMAENVISLPIDPLPNISMWNDRVKGPVGDNPILSMFWNVYAWSL